MKQTDAQTDPAAPASVWLRGLAGAAVLVSSWYAMMAVHELGHALAGVLTGGTVRGVALPWLGFSRTDVLPNPRPLVVAWAGPAAGVLLPAALWLGARLFVRPAAPLLRFFAGWCLLCNGVYLGLGWIDRVGDAGDLLRHGAELWQLIGFGVVCSAAGLWLWHGLGPGFGLRDSTRGSGRRLIAAVIVVLLLYASCAWSVG